MTSSSSRAYRHPRSMNIWSMEEIRTLRYLVAQGLSLEEIAIALGRSEFAVRNKAGVQGISLRRARASENSPTAAQTTSSR